MKMDLSYLPVHKQAELAAIVAAIRESVPTEMIILFGSYARNAWVEDWIDETRYRYLSDYDLLVIIDNKSEIWQSKYEIAIGRKVEALATVKTPISAIVHDIDFVNRRLKKAQYFFTDIKKEGVLLYDSGKYQLSESKELHPNERKKLAEMDFNYWFNSADEFLIDFKNAFDRGNYSKATFELHQATERFYTAILLVFTHYKPNTHNLAILRKLTNSLDNRFSTVFRLDTPENERLFELLKKGYVDARYNPNFKITAEELTQLAEKVDELKETGKLLCSEKINSFVKDVENN